MRRHRSRRVRVMGLSLGLVVSACAGAGGVRPTTSQSTLPPSTTTSSTAPSTTSTTAAPAPSIYGGTVVVGLADGGSPRTLNPLVEGPDGAVLDLLAPALFVQAFDRDPDSGRPIPDAVVSVPSLDDGSIIDLGDGTYDAVFEVVDGAEWADGVPITAADLLFTYELVTDPTLPIRADVADRYSGVVSGSAHAEDRRLTLRLRAGTDPADLFSIILPAHEVAGSDFTNDWDSDTWVAGGPFVLADWQPGQFMELVRNDRYWKVTAAEGAPLPFLERIVVRFFEPGPSLDARLVDGFTRAELAVVLFDHAEQRADELGSAISDGAVLQRAPSGDWEHLNFQFGPANRNEASQNASLSFRRAVAHALDRTGLAEDRNTAVADSILGRYVPDLGTAPFARYGFDQTETSRLLEGNAPELVVTVPGDDPAGLALGGDVVTMLRDAGFAAELQLEDSDLFFGSTLDNGSWDVGVWRNGSRPGLYAAADYIRLYDPDGLPFVGDNYFRWGTVDSTVSDAATQRYREIVDALDLTVDPATIESLVIEAEEILADQAVLLPLVVSGDDGAGFWPDLVAGVSINPSQGTLWNVDVWRVPVSGDQ